MTVPAISLGAVNLEAEDPHALARFWATVTGGTVMPAGEVAFLQPASPAGFGMFFQPRGDEPPARQTMHLDLTVPWGSRTTEVARLTDLGATWRWDVLDEEPHVQWTTLADPEGNLFCVAEHVPQP